MCVRRMTSWPHNIKEKSVKIEPADTMAPQHASTDRLLQTSWGKVIIEKIAGGTQRSASA